MLRPAAAAGTFYAGSADRLRLQLDALVPEERVAEPVIGVVVPHAGYPYSGRVAGAVYARAALPERCVILGPNHTGQGARASLMTQGDWETPLGRLPVDGELAAAIQAQTPLLLEDARSHAHEHSIEVQLPFLQYLGRPRRFVPVCLALRQLAACQEIGAAVAAGIRQVGSPVLLIASTDMSHYVSRAQAAEMDRRALEAVVALDPEALYRVVHSRGISMCGVHAVTAMLVAAAALGAQRGELVMYADSGEVVGDLSQVVAYAGLLVK
jgi:AmmeMemoRadiSam system protein B